jgi:Zn-dependent protease
LLLLGDLSIQAIISVITAALVGMTVHEFAHNYVGYLMGDPTPAIEGRLTLNPMKHINWFGFAMFILIGFGALGSAPISAYRMRNPRWGYLAAVAAGPVSNLVLATIAAIIFRLVAPMQFSRGFLPEFLFIMIYFNVLLFLFNLIPCFPLDGWHIVLALLPPDLARKWQSWQQYSYYAFFLLIMLSFVGGSFNILGRLIVGPAQSILNILIG